MDVEHIMSVGARQLFELLATNVTNGLGIIDGEPDIPEEEKVNDKMCLFPGTLHTYVDCCTESSLKVCSYLAVMFWACLVIYAGVFFYLMSKNPWVRTHGFYINVFSF